MITDKLLLTHKEIFEQIFNSIEQKKVLLLSYLNQNSFNIFFRNDRYARLLEDSFRVYQADTGMYLYLKEILKKNVERIDGTALNTSIIDELVKRKIPVGIIGGKFFDSFIKVECENRKIRLAGYYPGFFNETEKQEVMNKIKNITAEVFFIGMGVPKQEFFAVELSKTMENKIFICVGNFFEFYFGTMKRAPTFFQKLGLEWLFRLFTEPKRLWKRYVIGIPEFIFRAIKYRISNK